MPCWRPQANISNKVIFIGWSQGNLHCIIEGHRQCPCHCWIVIERNGGAMDCQSGFLGTWIHKNVCSSTRWAVSSYLGIGSGPKMAWLTTVWSPCIHIATWFSFICGTEMVIQWYHTTSIVSKFVWTPINITLLIRFFFLFHTCLSYFLESLMLTNEHYY
jgi:hypothetical protein